MEHMSHTELEKMVTFFYNADYDDELPDGTEFSRLQLHIRMFALADKYDIPDLSIVAAKKYSSGCDTSWNPSEFLTSIRDVYETTPPSSRTLRNLACIAIRMHLPQMLDDESIGGMYEETLTESPEFAKDLLRSYVHNPLYGSCATCGSSQPMEVLQARCRKCGKGNSGFCFYYN